MIMISKCQRRSNRTPKRNNSEAKLRAQAKSKRGSSELEEVLPPRPKRQQTKAKPMINRCCYATPDYRSFGQLIKECSYLDPIKHDNLVAEQYKSIYPDFSTIVQLQELTKVLCDANKTRVESASQYTKLDVASEHGYDVWQNVDNTDEIDKYIMQGRDEETLTQYHSLPKNFYISEAPRVKKVAEKFTKYKKNNIEVRKIEEKLVCVEYDVFNANEHQPVQRMRVFFAIKPVIDEKENMLPLPPSIENNFNITPADLQKLSQKEVEIIDGKIIENQPYLDDLRKILRRRQCTAKKDKTTLNLQNLYEMAKREFLETETDYDTNVLSKEGLIEVQNLILGSCKSSAYGINRTIVKKSFEVTSDTSEGYVCEDTISLSLVKELLKTEAPQPQ